VGRDVKYVSSHEHTLPRERYTEINSMEVDVNGVSSIKTHTAQKKCSSELRG